MSKIDQVEPKSEMHWIKNTSKGHRGFHYINESGDVAYLPLPRSTKVELSKALLESMKASAPLANQVTRGDFETSVTFK